MQNYITKISRLAIALLIVSSFFSTVINTFASDTTKSGSLIKIKNVSSVYYLDSDNLRHAFPSESVYYSWYENFNDVKTITSSELQSYPLSTNVTMRPGTKLIKITTDPSVYAVEPGGILRKIPSESEAINIYGPAWNTKVVDVSDAFFTNYTLGAPIASSTPPAGTLVKSSDTKYFYFDGNKYRQITSAETFRANRFKSENIISLNTSINPTVIGSSITSSENTLSDIHAINVAASAVTNSSNSLANNSAANNIGAGTVSYGGGGGGSSSGGGSSNGGGGGSINAPLSNPNPVTTATSSTSTIVIAPATSTVPVVPATTTPALIPSFFGDWESGTVTGTNSHNWGYKEVVANDRISIINDGGARQGNNYAKIEVRSGDNPIAPASPGTNRAEVSMMRNDNNQTIYENENSGTVQYNFSTKFDSTWQQPIDNKDGAGKFIIFFQLHPEAALTGAGTTFSFSATDQIRVSLRGGDITTNQKIYYNLSDGTLNIGNWVDWRFTVKYKKDATGYVLLERRNEGEANYNEVLNLTNIPTLAYSPNVNGGAVGNHYVKYGIYRNSQTFTSILYNDGFTRTTLP